MPALDELKRLFPDLHMTTYPAIPTLTTHPAMLQVQAQTNFFRQSPEAPTLGYTTEYTLRDGSFEISYLTPHQASITALFTRFPKEIAHAFELSLFALVHIMTHAKQPPVSVRGKLPLATDIIANAFRALWPDAKSTDLSLLARPVALFQTIRAPQPNTQLPETLQPLLYTLQTLTPVPEAPTVNAPQRAFV